MALRFSHIVVLFLLLNGISSHILIGRDITQRKIFRRKSGDESSISIPLTKGQKLMIVNELLKGGVIDLVLKFGRESPHL